MPRANANKWTRGRMVHFASCVDIFMKESYGSLVNGCTVVDMVVFYSMSVVFVFHVLLCDVASVEAGTVHTAFVHRFTARPHGR